MQKNIIKRSLFIVAVTFSFLAVLPAVSHAQSTRPLEAQSEVQEKRENPRQVREQKPRPEEVPIGEPENRQKSLNGADENKLKSCQKREEKIKNLFAKLSDRGTKHLEVFNKISDRTQNFYSEKGNDLSNYEALLSEVAEKKEAAETAVLATSIAGTEFKCDSEDPKALANDFKTKLQAQNTALKEYRNSIKNLIVGVKSAQNQTSSEENSDG